MINWAIFSVKFLDRMPECRQLNLLHQLHLAAISGTFTQVNFAKTPKIIKAVRSYRLTVPLPLGCSIPEVARATETKPIFGRNASRQRTNGRFRYAELL
jgi:hypothetical protein